MSLPTGRPRILFLTAYYFPFQGGAETHARSLASYLTRHDFRVVVLTRRVDQNSPALEEIDGVPVHRVPPAGPRTLLRKWAMIPFAIVKLVVLKGQYDIVYCPGYQGIGIAGIAAGSLLRRPVVLRSANLGVLLGKNWDRPLARWRVAANGRLVTWLKRRVRQFYMLADGFVCNCREIEAEALECRVPRDRVHYLPNAVDVGRYRTATPAEKKRIRSEQGWPDDVFVCLYVGRLSVEKGLLDLLVAWRGIGHDRKLLVLVGPDMTGNSMDVGPAARQYVSDNGLSGQVTFHGESTDVARLLRGVDAYVQPSRYEAFSNSLIEAMATGLPVVASSVGGMLDCVADNENGLLARPEHPVDLARQLSRLLEDPRLRADLGARARATAVEQFSESVIFSRFVALFTAVAPLGSMPRK